MSRIRASSGRAALRAALTLVVLVASDHASATGPSWPIHTDVKFPDNVGPEGGRATVAVTVSADASDIRLEVYGDDKMQVDPDNKLVVQLSSLHPGQSFTFDVGFRPGPGRSYLAVSAYARFGKTSGGAVHEFPFGSESAEQLAEHRKCVRQDSDGTWIREMGCDQDPPSQPSPVLPEKLDPPTPNTVPIGAATPITIDVATLHRAQPDTGVVRVEGYVVDSYICPPCPRGAMCKPCIMSTMIAVAKAAERPHFNFTDAKGDVAIIGVDDPSKFERGVRYRFEVRVSDKKQPREIDAVLLRSQRADEPAWPSAN